MTKLGINSGAVIWMLAQTRRRLAGLSTPLQESVDRPQTGHPKELHAQWFPLPGHSYGRHPY